MHTGNWHELLEAELPNVGWAQPTHYGRDKGRAITHLRSTARAGSHRRLAADLSIAEDLALGPIQEAFWAKIAPGGFILPHIDAGPWWERWHFPVRAAGYFWQDGEYLHTTQPFLVKHWLPHAVWVPQDNEERIHFIVDVAITPPDVPEYTNLITLDVDTVGSPGLSFLVDDVLSA